MLFYLLLPLIAGLNAKRRRQWLRDARILLALPPVDLRRFTYGRD